MKQCKRFLPIALALMMVLALLPMPASAARQGELVVPCKYISVGKFYDGFARIDKGGAYGFVDTEGNEFLVGKYDTVRQFTGAGIAPVGIFVRSSGKYTYYNWGLIDTTGQLVVPCENEDTQVSIKIFPSGLVSWKRNGKYGLLGANGQEVTPFIYDHIYEFRVDYAPVEIDNKQGLLDANGREVVPCIYDHVSPLSSYIVDGYAQDGMIRVELNGKQGFVNTDGELVVPCKYDRVSNFSGGYAAVGIAVGEIPQYGAPECKWGIVNTAGQEVVPCQYDSTNFPSVSDGLLVVQKGGKWGFVNTANKLVVPYKYDAANEFSNGYAIVLQNGKCGYIDATGEEIVPCQYEFTQGFHDGLAVLWKNEKRGFVDTTGKIVIPLQYYSASEFSEGFAAVKKAENGKYGYINTAGEAITPFQYDDAWGFKDGVALVERNGKLGYINTSGQEIIPCIYDIMSGGMAPNRYGNLVQLWLKGKYALVSTVTGQAVTDFEYYDMCNAHGDYISVQLLSGWGAVYTGAESAPANPTAPTPPPTTSPPDTPSTQRFSDVTPDAWYYEAVNTLAGAGIVNGVGDGKFEPNRPMTAGELATVLWNMMFGDWCKATELYSLGNNGYFDADYTAPNYPGAKIGSWGTAVIGLNRCYNFVPTTWDGSVALAVYGDSRIDPHNGNSPYKVTGVNNTQLINSSGRLAGKLYNESHWQLPDLHYSRDMSGAAVVAMSKEYVTRGFAISELVNVLRETGNLESIYNASSSQALYPTGASIPDWDDITAVYHDICAASIKGTDMVETLSGLIVYSKHTMYDRFHDYTWAWNYIDDPGNTAISGGYANTWFSADILLAYQAGLVSGIDSTGRCSVGAQMTRAEVCQLLYNAGVGKSSLQPKGWEAGGQSFGFSFIRDSRMYWFNTSRNSVRFVRTYDPRSDQDQSLDPENGTSYYVCYPRDGIDIRQQEWPAHPEFW